MKVSVIGTGYVGLVSGACLADKGHNVLCVDIDANKIRKINDAQPPIFERGLEALLTKHVGRNLRTFSDLTLIPSASNAYKHPTRLRPRQIS